MSNVLGGIQKVQLLLLLHPQTQAEDIDEGFFSDFLLIWKTEGATAIPLTIANVA